MPSFRPVFSNAVKIVLLFFLMVAVAGSSLQVRDSLGQIRHFTWSEEFDFLGWTLRAIGEKAGQWGLGSARYLSNEARADSLREYLSVVSSLQSAEGRLADVVGDPAIEDPASVTQEIELELASLRETEAEAQPIAESILQEQISVVISDMGINGVPFPPVAFQFTPLPYALIVSPREIIRQDANISLDPEMVFEDRVDLERRVEESLDVSALVVPIGGMGTYPTMVEESTSLAWLSEVVAHEWIHNYLSLRPLGINYNSSPELRTMNETVARLLGREIGRRVLERYYPDLVPPDIEPTAPSTPGEPPAFDFQAEMRETRLVTDDLLAQGKVEEAESYMEERRRVFWDNGYRIRRLNQAYFAFHGAYADQPGGAAGDDPVGAAVRELWERSATPLDFLRTMAWMNEFSDLQGALAAMSPNH